MNNKPIGIFDSGVGGLTVFKEIMKLLPNESIIYLGDTANLPYGDKSEEIVKNYSIANAKFLLKFEVKVIVIACNTASSVALKYLKEKLSIPIIGVIEPAVKGALFATRNNKIGVIGTHRTIQSEIYKNSLSSINPNLEIISKPCPLFVPLIEENFLEHEATKLIAKEYLSIFQNEKIDTLILGCTHYPLLSSIISEILPGVKLIDSAFTTAKDLYDILYSNNLLASNNTNKFYKFYATDITEKLNLLANRILNLPEENKIKFEKVKI